MKLSYKAFSLLFSSILILSCEQPEKEKPQGDNLIFVRKGDGGLLEK